jgi:hypothetical protein
MHELSFPGVQRFGQLRARCRAFFAASDRRERSLTLRQPSGRLTKCG